MASVLVTDGEQRSALAVVRSLGRAGHAVYVCSHRHSSLAGASRYARAAAHVPDPLEQPAKFAAAVRTHVQRWSIDVVLPVTEASLLAILPQRDRLGAALPFPTIDAFEHICDKAAVAEVAQGIGIGVPRQVRLDSAADRSGIAAALRFPVVLKPARSVVAQNGRRLKHAVHHAADLARLNALLDQMPLASYPLLVQERIQGPGVGVFVLLHDSKLIAAFSHRRIREKPPAGGVSVYSESIPLPPDLLESSVALLQHFGWTGAAMVEYKVDSRTGTPYIMEVNARFWGSLQLAIDSGVDFPALLVAAATGHQPQTVLTYRSGVRSRWFWGDVDHLLLRLRHSSDQLALAPEAPGRGRALFDFVTAFGPTNRNEVFRLSDPVPAIRETIDWLRRR